VIVTQGGLGSISRQLKDSSEELEPIPPEAWRGARRTPSSGDSRAPGATGSRAKPGPLPGWDPVRIARGLGSYEWKRLGYTGFVRRGGDLGAARHAKPWCGNRPPPELLGHPLPNMPVPLQPRINKAFEARDPPASGSLNRGENSAYEDSWSKFYAPSHVAYFADH